MVGLGSPCPRARIVTYANVKPAVSRAMSRPVGIAGSVDCPLVSLRSVGSAAASVFPSVAFSALPSGGDGTASDVECVPLSPSVLEASSLRWIGRGLRRRRLPWESHLFRFFRNFGCRRSRWPKRPLGASCKTFWSIMASAMVSPFISWRLGVLWSENVKSGGRERGQWLGLFCAVVRRRFRTV